MWSDSIARIKVSRTKPSDNVRLISNSIEWNAQKRFKYSVRIVFSLKITVSKTTQPLTWYTVLKGSVIDLSIQLEFKMRCLKLKCTSDLNVSIETISWSVNGKKTCYKSIQSCTNSGECSSESKAIQPFQSKNSIWRIKKRASEHQNGRKHSLTCKKHEMHTKIKSNNSKEQ